MIRRTLALAIAVLATLPVAGSAQGLGLGPRIGTLGLGAEVALGLTDQIVVRGGVGFVPWEPTVGLSGVDVTLKAPTVYNVGLDLYLSDAVRIGGGMLFRTDDPRVTGRFGSDQDIGGTTFTPQQIGTLTGVLDSKDTAPYMLIGFGRHTASGVGLFLDLGVAFIGDPTVRLSAEGGTLSADADPLMSALQQEASDFEDDMRGYLKLWPILSLGIRLGAY